MRPPPMIVTLRTTVSGAAKNCFATCRSALRRPMNSTLSPASRRSCPRGTISSPLLTRLTTREFGGRGAWASVFPQRGESAGNRYSISQTRPRWKFSTSSARGSSTIRAISLASDHWGQIRWSITSSRVVCSGSLKLSWCSSCEMKQYVVACDRPRAARQAMMLRSSESAQAMNVSRSPRPTCCSVERLAAGPTVICRSRCSKRPRFRFGRQNDEHVLLTRQGGREPVRDVAATGDDDSHSATIAERAAGGF